MATLLTPDQEGELRQLQQQFYQIFDASRLESFGQGRLGKRDRAFVGEGCFFESHRLPGSEAASSLVLSIAKDGFCEDLPAALASWQSALRKLRGQFLPLVPPLEVVKLGDRFAYASLYGPESEAAAAAHWQPLCYYEQLLGQALMDHGLVNHDVLQLRCLAGVPFNVDWSDLAFSKI